jgi:catechol 2,3-dioxygenase-like lactoylglutathione lyase family enzyme
MGVVGLHHVNLNVRDVDEAVAFYALLGCEVLPRPDFGFPGAWLSAGTHQIHLVLAPDAAIDPRQHFALEVDDADALAAALEAHGVEVRRARAVAGAGRQVFLRDPSGNRVELQQPDRP